MPEEVRQIFKRVEKKYLLESEEFNQLRGIMSDYMQKDIYDKYTFVEVPKANAKKVLEKLKNVKIKGNKINIEKANKKNK